jgi:hypothetical protein
MQAFLPGAGSPPQHHQMHTVALLPESPALLELPKSAQLSPPGDTAPQLWQASLLRKSITSGRPLPAGALPPRITSS